MHGDVSVDKLKQKNARLTDKTGIRTRKRPWKKQS